MTKNIVICLFFVLFTTNNSHHFPEGLDDTTFFVNSKELKGRLFLACNVAYNDYTKLLKAKNPYNPHYSTLRDFDNYNIYTYQTREYYIIQISPDPIVGVLGGSRLYWIERQGYKIVKYYDLI